MPLAAHDLLNFDFCCVTCGRGVVPACTGVDAPELGAVSAPTPRLLTAVDDVAADPDGVRDDAGGDAPPLPSTVGTESTDSDRRALARFGNIAGIRNPGESGFRLFCTLAGVGVAGV